MSDGHEVGFVTSETREKTAKGRTCYQGQLRHNTVRGKRETIKAFAEYCGKPVSRVIGEVEALGEFIAGEIAEGNRLDFGPFAVGLKLRGGFPSANAAYDAKVNAVSVEMTPGQDIRRAAGTLKPVNETVEGHDVISTVVQVKPFEAVDELAADGERFVRVTGAFTAVHPAVADEGVWLEDAAGERLLVGELVANEAGRIDCWLKGPLKAGTCWLTVQSRDSGAKALIRVRRRVSVV